MRIKVNKELEKIKRKLKMERKSSLGIERLGRKFEIIFDRFIVLLVGMHKKINFSG